MRLSINGQRGRLGVWAEVALAIGSVAPILGMPIIVGALQDGWGYTPDSTGYVSAIDLAGSLVRSIVTSLLAPRLHWRIYIAAAVTINALFNVLCVSGHSFGAICGFRFGAGCTSGATYASSLTLLSQRAEPTRGFSLMILLQVLANVAVLAGFPALTARWQQ